MKKWLSKKWKVAAMMIVTGAVCFGVGWVASAENAKWHWFAKAAGCEMAMQMYTAKDEFHTQYRIEIMPDEQLLSSCAVGYTSFLRIFGRQYGAPDDIEILKRMGKI